jgi:hypothetical protein
MSFANKHDEHTDKDVHVIGSCTNTVADDQQSASNDGDPSSTNDIGDAPNKGTDGGKREQISKNEPSPSVKTTDVAIDIWRATTIEASWC